MPSIPDTSVPRVTDVDVVVKQVAWDELRDFERIALAMAFRGYADDPRSEEELEERREELRPFLGGLGEVVDENYRRFAGDETLSRGRYYALAHGHDGDDSGTLVEELWTYYRASQSGMVDVFDTTLGTDRDRLTQWGIGIDGGAALIVQFGDSPARPSPASGVLGPEAPSFAVKIPLVVETRHLDQVVDLRDPLTAEQFARSLTEIRWSVGERAVPAFPHLASQESFNTVLPSLLEQNVGGTDFTQVIGLWLRHSGVRGLIYPSARTNPRVRVVAGEVKEWEGFNYIDYANADLPETAAFVHIASHLPERVRFCPVGRTPPWVLQHVALSFEREGPDAGSWRVEGLREFRMLSRLSAVIDFLLEELPGGKGNRIGDVLSQWLLIHLTPSVAIIIAEGVLRALQGDEHAQRGLESLIKLAIDTCDSEEEEEMRFIGALMDLQRGVALR